MIERVRQFQGADAQISQSIVVAVGNDLVLRTQEITVRLEDLVGAEAPQTRDDPSIATNFREPPRRQRGARAAQRLGQLHQDRPDEGGGEHVLRDARDRVRARNYGARRSMPMSRAGEEWVSPPTAR